MLLEPAKHAKFTKKNVISVINVMWIKRNETFKWKKLKLTFIK